MSTRFVVERKTNEHMIKLHKLYVWCEKNFGEADYLTTWNIGFYNSTDDWAAFTFYNPTMAFWFKSRFPEVMDEETACRLIDRIEW